MHTSIGFCHPVKWMCPANIFQAVIFKFEVFIINNMFCFMTPCHTQIKVFLLHSEIFKKNSLKITYNLQILAADAHFYTALINYANGNKLKANVHLKVFKSLISIPSLIAIHSSITFFVNYVIMIIIIIQRLYKALYTKVP